MTKDINLEGLDLSAFDENEVDNSPKETEILPKMSARELAELSKSPTLDEIVNTGEDFYTKLREGATLGLNPIIAGATKGLTRALTASEDDQILAPGEEPTEIDRLQILKDEYYKARKEEMEKQDAASERSPVASFAGNIVGGAPLAGLSKTFAAGTKLIPRVAQGVKEGAAFGAVAGFGSGEGDITNLEDVAADISEGAKLGAVMGGGIPLAGAATKGLYQGSKEALKTAGEVASRTKPAEALIGTYKATRAGKTLDLEEINKETNNFLIDKVYKPLNKIRNEEGQKISSILKDSSSKPQDVTALIKEQLDILKDPNNRPVKAEDAKAVDEAIAALENRFVKINDILEVKSKKYVASPDEQAVDKMKAIQEKLKEKALLEEKQMGFAKFNTGDTYRINPNEGTVSAQANYFVPKQVKGKTVMVRKPVGVVTEIPTGVNTPIQFNKIGEKRIIDATTTPEELGALQKDLSGLIYNKGYKRDELSNIDLVNDLVEKIKSAKEAGIPDEQLREDYLRANELYSKISGDVAEVTGDLSKYTNKGVLDETNPEFMQKVNQVGNVLRKADDAGVVGAANQANLDILTAQLDKVSPEMATDVLSKSKDLSERFRVAKILSERTGIQGLPVKGAEFIGKSAAKIKNKMDETGITEQLRNALPENVDSAISNAADTVSGSAKQIFKSAADVINDPTKGTRAKASARFAIMQQPALRQELRNNENKSNETVSSDVLSNQVGNINLNDVDLSAWDNAVSEVSPQVETPSTFSSKLAESESGGNYEAVNGEHKGKFQHSNIMLEDMGYKDKQGNWLPESGITTDAEYLKNPQLQEKIQKEWETKLDGYIKGHNLEQYIGKTISGTDNKGKQRVKLTRDGLRAAMHLNGPTAIANMFKTGIVPNDSLGTSAFDYMKKFE